MKLTIEINEDEILEAAKKMIIEEVASRMLNQYKSTAERYNYRTVIKECVREVIKSDIDNLSERAVKAACVTVANKTLKKVSTAELLERIAGMDGEA